MQEGAEALENPAEAVAAGAAGRPWTRAIAAMAAATAILVLATLAAAGAGGVFDRFSGVDQQRAWPAGSLEALTTARLAVFLLTFQAVTVMLAVLAAALFGRGRVRLLPLSMPVGGARVLVVSVVVLMALASVYAFAVFTFDRGALVADVKPFADLMRARTWWLMLIAAAIGAPLAEEILFRGFLYGVLQTSPVGVIGAGLVTAVTWSALHANYSGYGLGAIFLIGLYLAFLRHKTGSLVAPMVCHGLYNALIVLALSSAPDSVLSAG